MSGKSSKQRFEKHLRIGTRFNGNQFVLLDGSPLPALSKGSIVELILAPESILDSTVRSCFLEEMAVTILEIKTCVFFGVSPTMDDDMKAHGLIRREARGTSNAPGAWRSGGEIIPMFMRDPFIGQNCG
jgi:hypothetical protein